VNWFKSFWKALTAPLSPDLSHHSLETINNSTPRAQQVLALARVEADRLHHSFVGTEHLLLGLIRLGQGTAVTVLGKMGIDLESVRAEVEKQVGAGPDVKSSGAIPYTPRVKKVLALAAKEAKALHHTYVGTEHILLGLLGEGDGVAARVLKNLGINTDQTRQEILREVDPHSLHRTQDSKPADVPQKADLPKGHPGSVDTSKRYDVYCAERNQELVLYRNVIFKGRSKLLSTRQFEFGSDFLELEQSNGQVVYISPRSVLRFCEHGAKMVGETIPPQ
jgi:ATP-dependent Clp protease ATP-binding subunit ClpA